MSNDKKLQLAEQVDAASGDFARRWNASRRKAGESLVKRFAAGQDFKAGGEVNLQTIEEELARHMEEFSQDIAGAGSVEEVYDVCAGYIEHELTQLCYHTNNLPLARLKRDHYEDCLRRLLPILRDHPGFAEYEEKFARLRPAYDLGLEGYDAMRREVYDATGRDTSSLLDFCHRELAEARRKDPTNKSIPAADDEDGITDQVHRVAWELLEQYGFDGSETPPHATLFALASKACNVTNAEMLAKFPGKNLAQIKRDHPGEVEASIVGNIDIFYAVLLKDRSYKGILDGHQQLQDRLEKVAHISEDFMTIKATATKAAGLTVATQIEHFSDRYAEDRHLPLPKIQWRQKEAVPFFYGARSLERQWERDLPQMERYLAVAQSPLAMLSIFEAAADDYIERVLYRGVHPSNLLMFEAYLHNFRETLVEDLNFRGHKVEQFSEGMQAIAAKSRAGYENYIAMQDLLMDATNEAHDSLYVHQMLRFVDDTGIHPKDFTRGVNESIAMECQDEMDELQKGINVPASLKGQSLVPLLYARCIAIAEQEQEEEMSEARGYQEILAARKSKGDQEKTIEARAHALLEDIAAMVQPGADGQEVGEEERQESALLPISSAQLKQIEAYLQLQEYRGVGRLN